MTEPRGHVDLEWRPAASPPRSAATVMVTNGYMVALAYYDRDGDWRYTHNDERLAYDRFEPSHWADLWFKLPGARDG